MAEQSKSLLLDSLFGGPSDARNQAYSGRGYENPRLDSAEESTEKTSDSDFADCITGIFHKAKREALRDLA